MYFCLIVDIFSIFTFHALYFHCNASDAFGSYTRRRRNIVLVITQGGGVTQTKLTVYRERAQRRATKHT